eukprot:m.53646 g.53646  ORF g.53646 m.53646 type:complete len:436 (+) comp7470_c0_seq3:54-1361(+)
MVDIAASSPTTIPLPTLHPKCVPRTMLSVSRVTLLSLSLMVSSAAFTVHPDSTVTQSVDIPSRGYPIIARPPRWGWDTVGDMVFVHSGQAKSYTTQDLELLSRFAIVQFDKKQNLADEPNASQEDRFIAAARAVKATARKAGRDVQVLMYINALINFPAGRLHGIVTPSMLLNTSTGKPARLVGNTVFDPRVPAMRRVFVEDALYGMATGYFDGVFIDRADWAIKSDSCDDEWGASICAQVAVSQRQVLSELTDALTEGNITLSKETSGAPMNDWQVANAAMTSDTFCSHYCHGCNDSVDPKTTWMVPDDAQQCANSMVTLANMSARGQLTQAHGMGPYTGPYAAAGRMFTLAAFLVATGNLSYYSYANWASASWELSGTAWWPEYNCSVGTPTTPPNTRVPGTQWKFTRSFSSGTSVNIDLATRDVSIRWGRDC